MDCSLPGSSIHGLLQARVGCLVAKLSPIIWDLMDYSPPGSSVHRTFQARILEWVAISFSRGSSQPKDWTRISCNGGQILYHGATREAQFSLQFSSLQSLSHVRLFATPWITARQASLSITNSRSSRKLTSIKSVMPSSHLILCRPLRLLPPNPSQHQSLFQWVKSSHEVAKVLEFQL